MPSKDHRRGIYISPKLQTAIEQRLAAEGAGESFSGLIRRLLVQWLNQTAPMGQEVSMSTYTYAQRYPAKTASGEIVTIPDQVADDQEGYDGKTFPVIRRDGSRCRARLMGDWYGLHSGGTGDVKVKLI